MNILTTQEMLEGLFGQPWPRNWLHWIPASQPLPAWLDGPSGKVGQHLIVFGLGLFAASGLSWLLSYAISRKTRPLTAKARPAETFVKRGLLGMGLCGLALATVGWFF